MARMGRRCLRFSAGAAATRVATLNRSGWRDGPRRSDGDARNSTRTDNRAAPATLRLHLDVSILRQAQDRYVAKNALASATEATRQCCLAAMEEPGAHIKHEHLATPLGMPPDRTATVHLTVTRTTISL
jgi:hypothetical protein